MLSSHGSGIRAQRNEKGRSRSFSGCSRKPWVPSTCACDLRYLYIENPKDSTGKLLELINEYSKVAGYKINTEKSLAFLYTNNEKTEREIKETIPFIKKICLQMS